MSDPTMEVVFIEAAALISSFRHELGGLKLTAVLVRLGQYWVLA